MARSYRWLEFVAFGRALERCRFDLMPWLSDAERVLTVGEGDGRFVAELARRFPQVEVDCLEASDAMIAQARQRLHAGAKVTFHLADARDGWAAAQSYDAVVTCFFLDCFTRKTLSGFMPVLAGCLHPEGRWLVAEFCQPPRGWAAWHARAWLRLLYAFFQRTVRLEAGHLPEWELEMARQDLKQVASRSHRWGLLRASCWSFTQKDSQNSA